jgi:DNA-binding transcriptional ArsR family regulator
MAIPDGFKGLRFPCECVSARPGGYSDPWADITKRKLLPNGTKEEILNLVAREPKTISELAEALNLSPPGVHTHINEMMKSELLRESEEWEKKYPTERYYEPNFPVFKSEECAEFKALCEEMSKELVRLFERKRQKMESLFVKLTFRNKVGSSRISHSACTQICSPARALSLRSADYSRRARNMRMAQNGSFGPRSHERAGSRIASQM